MSTEWAFWAYGRPLTSVPSLKYFGQIIMALEDDWLVVVRNRWKAQHK